MLLPKVTMSTVGAGHRSRRRSKERAASLPREIRRTRREEMPEQPATISSTEAVAWPGKGSVAVDENDRLSKYFGNPNLEL